MFKIQLRILISCSIMKCLSKFELPSPSANLLVIDHSKVGCASHILEQLHLIEIDLPAKVAVGW